MVFNKDDNDDNNDGEADDNNDEVPHALEPFCSWNDGLSVDDDSDAGDETDPFNRNTPITIRDFAGMKNSRPVGYLRKE